MMTNININRRKAIKIAQEHELEQAVRTYIDNGLSPYDALKECHLLKYIISPIIICIVGDSGSGKTLISTIFKELFNWNLIVSYTTRNKRTEETDGVEHYFVSSDKMPNHKDMLAYTKYGGYEYWTTKSQFVDYIPNIYVIDEKGIDFLSKQGISNQLILIKVNRIDKTSIDNNRVIRDIERIHIPDTDYQYIIQNNSTINNLYGAVYKIGQEIKQMYNI